MTVINTNTAAINAQYNLSKVQSAMDDAMSALSSGKRINSAADDAAGLSIATRMEAQVRGLNQAMRNAADGQSMVDTAEGAMDEITNMLQRMRELALQAANDTNTLQDRTNIDAEVTQLKAEINRVVSTTTFNGQNLLDGSYAGKSLQIGFKAPETLAMNIGNYDTTALGTSATSAGVSGVTANTASGSEAVTTIAQMAFNGNDSYGFTLAVGNGSGGSVNLAVAGGAVVGGDAADVATKLQTAINAAVTANTLSAGDITVSANGNVLTINNNLGDSLDISAFTSSANGSASYSSVSGAGVSKLLDDTAPVTSVSNTGGGAATTATGSLVIAEGKDYNFRVNGSLISLTNFNGVGGTSMADALAAIKLAIGSGGAGTTAASAGGNVTFSLADSTGNDVEITNFNAVSSPQGSAGSMVMTVRVDGDSNTASNTFANGGGDTSDVNTTDIVQLSFTEAEAEYAFTIDGAAGSQNYTVSTAAAGKTLAEALAVTRDAINANTATEKVVARVVDGKLEIENEHTAAITIDTFSSTGKAAVTAGAATLGATNLTATGTGSTTNGVTATKSQMTMQFSQDDNYSFKIGGTTITASVSGGSLASVESAVNANSGATGVTASTQNGVLVLEHAAGGAINVTNFTSAGTGEISAANAAGQGGSAVLNDDAAVTAAATAAAGKADPTIMDLTMDASDKVTFQISDGRTNAVVRLTTFDPANNAAIVAEITSALSAVGSDIAVSTAGVGAKLTLTNSKGGAIDLTGFTSDSTGKMTATPATGQGVGKILNDDGVSGSQASVSAISLTSLAGANAAIGTVDRALEQINAQRSELGAISNRLDHTISNLGNIVVNTEAAQSRIEDADFAAETGNLTKAQILSQAATAMLAQANASKQSVLSLLQG